MMNTNCCMNERICEITLIDPESNKEIGSFNCIPEINITRNRTEKCLDPKGSERIITKDERVLSFTTNTSEFHPEILEPDQFTLLVINKKQIRKHHKKRINKKWLKRYGYKEQLFDFGNWNYRATDKFGEYEFERKII